MARPKDWAAPAPKMSAAFEDKCQQEREKLRCRVAAQLQDDMLEWVGHVYLLISMYTAYFYILGEPCNQVCHTDASIVCKG